MQAAMHLQNMSEALREEGIMLIDCQVYTEYLESMGAVMIPRKEFSNYLENL